MQCNEKGKTKIEVSCNGLRYMKIIAKRNSLGLTL